MFRACDEIGERVFLFEQLAVIVPFFAQFGAAADVRDGEDETPVEQAQPIGGKSWIDAVAVRAVAVEQQGTRSISLKALAIDQRNRHFDAIGRFGEDPLGLILRRVVASAHFVLLLQLALARSHVVVEHGRSA